MGIISAFVRIISLYHFLKRFIMHIVNMICRHRRCRCRRHSLAICSCWTNELMTDKFVWCELRERERARAKASDFRAFEDLYRLACDEFSSVSSNQSFFNWIQFKFIWFRMSSARDSHFKLLSVCLVQFLVFILHNVECSVSLSWKMFAFVFFYFDILMFFLLICFSLSNCWIHCF